MIIDNYLEKSQSCRCVYRTQRATLWSQIEFASCENIEKQAGNGPSRRHIQGSKIAKRLPSVKYSFTVVENRKFSKFIF